MTQQIFKFISPIPSISAVYNATLVAGDTLLNVFSKLQGLLIKDTTKNIITTTNTGGTNTTADFNLIALTIPANTLQIGSQIHFDITITLTKNVTNSNINLWIKDNAGTKVLTDQIPTGNTTATNVPIRISGYLTIRSIGAAGTYVGTITYNSNFTTVTTAIGVAVLSTPSAIDTTLARTFTVGTNMSVASAATTIRTVNGGIWID